MKLSTQILTLSLICSAGVATSYVAVAEETAADMASDLKAGAKKAVRAVKDEACVDGKVKCAAKKAKHKVENTVDDAKK